jgi:Flp pilus assembly protein TadD
MTALLGEYKHLTEQLASQYGSLHANFTGDGHFLVFEDADAAVRFALTLIARWRQAFDGSPALKSRRPLPLRVGIHFGEETQLKNAQAWVGRSGNLAKRIEGEAEPDTAYVSEGLLDLLDLPLYKVSRIGPRSLRGDHLAKRVLYRVHEFDEAVFSARPDLQLTASDWFLRGVAMIGTPEENTDAEAECYEEALRLRPDYAEAHYNYAFLLKERGDLEGAEGHYQEALRLRPDDPKAHYNYAILLKERGDLRGVEGHYQEALRLRPEYAEAHYNYAVLLKERRDLEGAEGHYQEALRLRPDDPEGHHNYAVLLQERGDLEGAAGQYQEALRLRPDDPEAHYNYAVLLKQCCLPRRSKYHFERALRLAPDDPRFESAYQRRAWLRDKG